MTMAETRWALMKWQNIMDLDEPSEIYLRRLRIITTPLFSLKLHKILLPDRDRALHDHPWNFAALILKGGYTEELTNTLRTLRPGHFNFKRAEGLHRIVRLADGGPAWTLVFCGRLRRNWGFMTRNGWMDHETYLAQRHV